MPPFADVCCLHFRGDMISAATLPLTLPVVFPEDLERRNADNQ
jgi:hypothetical protein